MARLFSARQTGSGIDVPGFWRDGYTIVRGAYESAEVDEFRRHALSADRPRSDLLADEKLRSFLTDGRLAGVARELLGSTNLLYTGDSAASVGRDQRGHHKDNADRDNPDAPDWGSDYTILRFGLYLQDHRRHSGGLNVREGSHRHVDTHTGRNRYLRTGVGDLAVWSLRSTHSGNGDLLRFPWWRDPGPLTNRKFPWWCWQAPLNTGMRIALFAAIGLDDQHGERYGDYLKSRTYIVNIWRNTEYTDDALREARSAGIEVRDMPNEIVADASVGKNEKWKAIGF